MSSNAATAKVEVHINVIFLRGAACSLGQLVPWRPPQWTAELKFHKDQVCFWNSAIVNVPKRDARCLDLLCECRPQLVWKSIHACDSHSFSYYNFRSRLPRACPLVTIREGSNDASLVLGARQWLSCLVNRLNSCYIWMFVPRPCDSFPLNGPGPSLILEDPNG